MKKLLLFVLVATGAIFLSGCAEKEESIPGIEILPAIKTRVTGLHFDSGDCIGLTITKGGVVYVQNHMMTYAGSTFSGSGLLWYNDLNEKSTLTAYYPYSAKGVPEEFSVATDQTGGNVSSDLLGAVKRDVTPVGTPVGMVFYHLMSQLSIIMTNNSDAAVSGVTVGGLTPTAVVDLSVPTATMKAGAAAEIKAFEVTPDASYRVVLVPQQAALTVTVATHDGKSRSKTISSATLESGKRYDMSVVVTNIDIELTLSGDVSDWNDGGSLDDDDNGNSGDSGGGSETSELTYGGVTYRTVKIGEQVWMAENLRYRPVGSQIEQGIWYPKDGESVAASQGLLYNYAMATNGSTTRAGGSVQGICPDGWHIPNTDELQSLAENTNSDKDFFSYPGYWNTNIKDYGDLSRGYLMGCEISEVGKCNGLLYTTAPNAQINAVSVKFGISLRCVKN